MRIVMAKNTATETVETAVESVVEAVETGTLNRKVVVAVATGVVLVGVGAFVAFKIRRNRKAAAEVVEETDEA
jgi:Na+-transporting NADH:ubiquinone oxidoreductase subunit NqrD